MTAPPWVDFDPFAPEVLARPEEFFGPLREQYPVFECTMGDTRLFVVTGYTDQRALLGAHRELTNRGGIGPEELPPGVAGYVISTHTVDDERRHRLHRDLLAQDLGPVALAIHSMTMPQIADELVAQVLERGTFDARWFGQEYVGRVFGEAIVGIPREWMPLLFEWADRVTDSLVPRALLSAENTERIGQLAEKLAGLGEVLAPGSAGARIFAAANERRITMPEAISLVTGAYGVAGLHTSVEFWSNTFWLLANYPEQWAVLREDPGLSRRLIAEVLRHQSVFRRLFRCPAREVEVGGFTIPATTDEPGIRVMLPLESAHYDRDFWRLPELFDITREGVVDDHLGFGHGYHHCAGHWAVAAEAATMLRALAMHVRDFEVDSAHVSPNRLVKGYAQLDVTVRY